MESKLEVSALRVKEKREIEKVDGEEQNGEGGIAWLLLSSEPYVAEYGF